MKRFTWGVLVCLISAMAVMLPACNNAGGLAVAFVQAITQAVDNGQTFNITAQVKNDSSNKGVTWSLVSGPGSLTNETTTSATYNAPPIGAVAARSATQQATPQAAVIKATSIADSSKSATMTINVTPPPSMSNQTLPAGTEGNAYSQQVAETGGAGTLSWQIISGSQPAGLTINSGTGVISGTPTGPNGSSTFTVKVTDSNAGAGGPQSAQAQVTIVINLPAPPKINPAGSALPPATEGAAYSQTLTVSGGLANYTWSVIGNLPAGLTGAQSADTKSFTISGKPTGPTGTTNFQIKVADSSNPVQSDTESYSITVNLPAPPKINPAGGALAAGTEGTAYSQPALTVSGGLANFTWTVIGSLPAGLTGTQSPGGATFTISGTPTGPNGTANFQIKVTDSSNPPQSDTENFSITINLPPAPKINPAGSALPAGTEGTAYSQPFTVSGGLGNFTWTVVGGDANLPAGLHSAQSGTNNNTFTISGTPTGPNGTTNFQIKVTDSSNPPQSDTENYSITINLPPPPKISPASGALPAGNVGTPMNQQFTVSGGLGPTFTWSESGTLPAGLTFNASNSTGTTVAITGTPTTAQTNVPFSVTVMDSSNPKQSITNNYTLTINPPAPFMITTSSLANGNFNQVYNATISAQGGIAPYTFSLDASSSPLPSGLNFSSSNNQGVISGTPTTAGTFTNIIVDAHDSQGTPATDSKTYTLTINAPTLVFMPSNNSSLPTGTVNQTYSGVTISASGGVQPYTFSQDATSQLPTTGLTFTPGTNQATITGTPTQSGTFNVVVDFQDSEHPPVMQKLTYTLTISASAAACGSGSESLLKGQYTATLQGHDSSGPVGIGLMFDADGLGGVAKGGVGIEDINSNSAAGVQQNLSIDSSKSSYSIGSDHRFCLTIVTGTTNQTFRGSLSSVSGTPVVATNGHIIEFDTTRSNTAGILRKQDITVFNTSNFVGFSFAFGASGAKASGGKFGVAGVFSISAGGTIPTGGLDANDNGTLDGSASNTTFPSSPVPFTGSSSIGLNGRGTFTFNVPGTTGVHGILYVVSASELLAMSSDAQTTNTLFVGKVLKQTQSSFSASDVTGKTYVVYTSGLAKGVAGGTRTSLGTFAPTSSSAFNITLNQSDGGSLTTQSGSGTYSLASDGRELAQITGANHNSALYLASPNVAFVLDGSGQVETGFAESQSGSPFGAGSAKSPPSYAFGTIQPEVSGVDLNSGVANFDGVSTVTGTSDDNSSGTLNPSNAFSQAYSIASTGTGLIPHSGTSCSFTAGTCDLIFIVISPPSSTSPFGRAALMDAKAASGGSNTTPALSVADQ